MAKHKAIGTKLEIVKTATRLIWEKGYTAMSTRTVAAELDISVGNITYYYPSKDDLLSILVNSLCKFQRKLIEDEAEDGISSVMAVCLELMTMASACESNPIAKDFFISSYQSPVTLKIIRENDTERSKEVYKEYCKGWTDEQFAEAEVLVSGIEYATLMSLDEDIPLETRIAEALDKILYVYNVPKKIRETKIKKALSYDYKHIGERIFKEFKEYVDKTTEETFEQMLQNAKCEANKYKKCEAYHPCFVGDKIGRGTALAVVGSSFTVILRSDRTILNGETRNIAILLLKKRGE